MAGLFVEWLGSTVIEKLTNFICDAAQEEYHQLESTQKLLEKLNLNLPLVRKLADVAAGRLAVDPALSDWLKQFKDIIYEADDLLGELDYEKLRLKVSASAISPVNSIKKFFISDPCLIRLKDLVEKLEEIASRAVCIIEFLKLDDDKNMDAINERNESTSLIYDDEKDIFFGREIEKEIILDILLYASSQKKQKTGSGSGSNRKELIVLPIIGIGGVGKTTLAKVIYNDPIVRDHFHLKAWVYVSNSYDTKRILFETINLFSSVDDIKHTDSLEKMMRRLIQVTSGETFFFVFDDVSELFVKQWKTIGNALRQGKSGGAILVTTQSAKVADQIGNHGPINLNVLNEDDYWSLFKYHAFGETRLEQGNRRLLEKIGQDISRKLNGLPLAARTLGQLLRTRFDLHHWLTILTSEWWEHKDVADEIVPSLSLSYEHLNSSQKQCFAYCSIFPNNYLFDKKDIVQMWIAQGYIQSSGNVGAEDIGNECFEELTRRSFFLYAWNEKYIMHHLMLNLAKYVSRDECFVMENESAVPPHKVRHLTVRTDGCPKVAKIVCEHNMLRTLLVFGDWSNYPCEETLEVLFKKLKSLRVLDFSCAFPRGLNLPSAIGDLLHLRYLDMRGNGKILLDDSICKLFHLQVLNLDWLPTQPLPSDINNLINLRHLYTDCDLIDKICSIGKLTNLQGLKLFTAKKEKGYRIVELKEMNRLHGRLDIAGLENVESKEEAFSANIRVKKYLSRLMLKSSDSDPQRDEEIFEGLHPHPNLRELKIEGYSGLTLPSWMMEIQNLSNLKTIILSSCVKLQNLPPLGKLPYLRSLHLYLLKSIAQIGNELYGNENEAFPCLEELKLQNLENLTQWEDYSGRHRKAYFPCLLVLEIHSCHRLRKLHDLISFSSLKVLQVRSSLDNSPLQNIGTLTNLTTLEMHNIMGALASLSLSNLTALKDLSLVACSELWSIDGLQSPVNLKRVTILRCPMLASSSHLNRSQVRSSLPSVTYLCTDESVFMGDESVLFASLQSLQTLYIENIDNEKFGTEQEEWFEQLLALQELQFDDCSSLSQLPVSLVILPLVKLTINDCPSIKSLPEKCFPVSLQVLEVENCPNLSRLPASLVNLPLVKLTILFCRLIESLPENGLPASLQDLHIYGCPKLQARCEKETGPDWPMIAHIPFVELRSSRNSNRRILRLLKGINVNSQAT